MQAAIVVLVPHDHDCVVATAPGLRGLDARDDPVQRVIRLRRQAGVEAHLRAVGQTAERLGALVELTEPIAIAATVLVVALIRDDEGERRYVARGEIGIQAVRAVEAHGVAQAVAGEEAFLDAAKVGERIVLHCVLVHEGAARLADRIRRVKRDRRQVGRRGWFGVVEGGGRRYDAIAVVNQVGAGERL